MNTQVNLYLCVSLFTVIEGAIQRPIVYNLPAGLQSVNGSDPNGGCPQNCVTTIISTFQFICLCPGGVPATGVLTDGVVPTFDPVSDTDWSSGLFTVNRRRRNSILFDFWFASNYSLRGVEMKLFNCPEWNIAASTINVYAGSFSLGLSPSVPIASVDTLDSQDCTSLTTVSIPVQLPTGTSPRVRYYIEFTFNNYGPRIEWAPSIGEIQFNNETPTTTASTTSSDTATASPNPELPTNITSTSPVVTTKKPGTTESVTTGTEGPTTTPFSPIIIIVVVLVAVFGVVSLTLIAALAVVCVRYRRFAQSTATEAEYEDVRETDNRAIELRTNEAYGNTRPPGSEEDEGYEVIM